MTGNKMDTSYKQIQNPTPVGEVLNFIERIYGVNIKQLQGKLRDQPVVEARKAFSWIARHKLNWTYPFTGKFLHRDHSTIMHFVKTFDPDSAKTSLNFNSSMEAKAEFHRFLTL